MHTVDSLHFQGDFSTKNLDNITAELNRNF